MKIKLFIVIHHWMDEILEDARVFTVEQEAKEFIDIITEQDPTLDYKDRFSIHKLEIEDQKDQAMNHVLHPKKL